MCVPDPRGHRGGAGPGRHLCIHAHGGAHCASRGCCARPRITLPCHSHRELTVCEGYHGPIQLLDGRGRQESGPGPAVVGEVGAACHGPPCVRTTAPLTVIDPHPHLGERVRVLLSLWPPLRREGVGWGSGDRPPPPVGVGMWASGYSVPSFCLLIVGNHPLVVTPTLAQKHQVGGAASEFGPGQCALD